MSPEATTLPAELEERLQFETLIADLSSKFINLPPPEVDREIADALRLALVAQVFTNALARKRADQALHESGERLSLAAGRATRWLAGACGVLVWLWGALDARAAEAPPPSGC